MIPMAKPLIAQDELAAVTRVLASGQLAQGPEVAAFEERFSSLVGRRHCVAVNSGTSALHLALVAAGIRPGDDVIVPSFSFAATANAVRLTGATPVFVDIEPAHFCIDPAAVEAAITPRTTAVIPVHLYGHPAAMHRIGDIAAKHALAVIEDACQAHAAMLDGTPVGAFGAAAAFSFFPTKNMTTGEGGMVVTPDAEFARTVRLLRNQGMETRYANEIVGYNLRMTDIGASIGRVQLARLPTWTATRRYNAGVLDAGLYGVDGIEIPQVADGALHVYHQYTVRIAEDRDGVVARLATHGVASGVYYPTPIHRLPSFDQSLELPETERAAREVLSVPVHPALSQLDLEAIVAGVTKAVAG
jgi:perosamine synthetase